MFLTSLECAPLPPLPLERAASLYGFSCYFLQVQLRLTLKNFSNIADTKSFNAPLITERDTSKKNIDNEARLLFGLLCYVIRHILLSIGMS